MEDLVEDYMKSLGIEIDGGITIVKGLYHNYHVTYVPMYNCGEEECLEVDTSELLGFMYKKAKSNG